MNVNVTYTLSQDGQRAALVAGRTATQKVVETLPLLDMAMLAECGMTTGGKPSYVCYARLDAPPVSVDDLIAAAKAEHAKLAADRLAREEAEKADRARRRIEDAPKIAAAIAKLEALPESEPAPYRQALAYMITTDEELNQYQNLVDEHAKKHAAWSEAQRIAKQAAKDAEIELRGGTVFPVEGGMCSFKGHSLWTSGQTKRWVGVFSAAKGIDRFLPNPKGEFVFDVRGLTAGQCIQGGGYDTNSRGKRRSETEFFGVVVTILDSEIVVRLCDSRADAFKLAAKYR